MPEFWQIKVEWKSADEIRRDICKYQVSFDVADDAWYNHVSDMADDAWYNYVYNISFCAKWIPSYTFYMPEFWQQTAYW